MYIGVDLGTSSLKLLVSDNEGKVLFDVRESYDVLKPKLGYSEISPLVFKDAFLSALKKVDQRIPLKELNAISFSGQMHGLVCLDKDDRPVRNVILWNDNRAIKECKMLNGKEKKSIQETGNIAFPGFTLPKLLWMRKHEPALYKKIDKIMLPKDYLVYLMTGKFVSDVSDLSGTLFYDVKNHCYAKKALEIAEIDEEKLPRILGSVDVAGTPSQEFLSLLSVNPEAKVVVGGGDQAMGALGTGTIKEKTMHIQLGTSGVVYVCQESYKENKNQAIHHFADASGKYLLMGVTLNAAGALAWWTDDVLESSSVAKELEGIDALDTGDLLFLPYLNGERSPINDPFAKGVFYGINIAHDRKYMNKAVIEGVGLALYDSYKEILKTVGEVHKIRIIGGGSKSPAWCQIMADIFNHEISLINTNDGGSLGAIVLAMVADHKFASIEEAADHLIWDTETYVPNPKMHAYYERKYRAFKKLYRTLKEMR